MRKFTNVTSLAIPLDKSNIDTDAIIPKQFLKSIKRTGFGDYLFDSWRYVDYAELGDDCSKRDKNKDFILNDPTYKNSSILLTKDNFGCGSSREHAVWAINDYGIRAIIATSFADIFYNNCIKNSILPVVIDKDKINLLFSLSPTEITINLVKQKIFFAKENINFDITQENKKRLLEGLDDIDITLIYKKDIESFENKYYKKYSWLL